jgi:hypothetical protein
MRAIGSKHLFKKVAVTTAFLAWPNYMTHGEDALRKNMKKVE